MHPGGILILLKIHRRSQEIKFDKREGLATLAALGSSQLRTLSSYMDFASHNRTE